MKNFNVFSVISLLSIALFSCCKDEPKCQDPTKIECENYDLCFGKKAVSAAFKIEELVGARYFETDTIGYRAKFTALEAADSYTWYLGSEVINEKSFDRSNFPRDKWINIKLVVRKKVDVCFSNNTGVDSSTKRFYVWPETEIQDGRYYPYTLINPYPIYGTYNGSLISKPNLVFNASILDTNWTNETGRKSRVGIIRGIPYPPNYGTDKINRNNWISDYCDGISPRALSLYCERQLGIPAMKGYAWLDKNNSKSITIAYSFQDTLTGIWALDTFRGKKIY